MDGPDALINKGRPNQTIPVRLGHGWTDRPDRPSHA